MRKVSAAVANREFSKILREVAAGETVIVTSRGKPVAEIAPVCQAVETGEAERRQRHRAFLDELSTRPTMNFPRLTRDEFYE